MNLLSKRIFKKTFKKLMFVFLAITLIIPTFLGSLSVSSADDSASSPSYIYPKNHTPQFGAELNADGSIKVSYLNKSYTIKSFFSYPKAGGWNTFGKINKEEVNWKVVVKSDKLQASGSGFYFTVNRSIEKQTNRIIVKDTIENISNSTIGIKTGHYIDSNGETQDTYVAGHALPYQYLNLPQVFSLNFAFYENPTVFNSINSMGLGLVAEDDVFRAEGSGGIDPKADPLRSSNYAQLRDDYFGLKAGQKYTQQWSIYPTDSPDYYDFINIVRKENGVNFQIDNFNFLITHKNDPYTHWDTMSDDEFKKFLLDQNVKYIGIHGLEKKDASNVHGTAFYDEVREQGSDSWEMVNLIIDKIKKTGLDVHPIIYLGMYIDSHDNVAQKYPDSILYDRVSSNPRFYLNNPEYLEVMPLVDNSYGKELLKDGGLVDFLMNKNNINKYLGTRKIDGIYTDVYNSPDSTFWFSQNPNASYTEDYGYIIDSNNKITKDAVNILVAGGSFRTKLTEKIYNQGGVQVGNCTPLTSGNQQIKRPHFIEGQDRRRIENTHFYSPVVLSDQKSTSNGEDDILQMRLDLEHGALHYPYTYRPDWDGNPYQTIYPITPAELHPGYIIGKEKIVTIKPGIYGWGDNSNFTVYTYNQTGHLVDNNFTTKSYNGMTFADLSSLPANYLAVIVKCNGVCVSSPTRSGASPSGILSQNTTSVKLSLRTDNYATCRYSTVPGTAYEHMTSILSSTLSQTHSITLSNLKSGQYKYYTRCKDVKGNVNKDDYLITFNIAAAPQVLTSIKISPDPVTVKVGATQTMTATAKDQKGSILSPQPGFTWSSSDSTIATITSAGLLKGIKTGTTTVMVKADGIADTATVAVKPADVVDKEPPVIKILGDNPFNIDQNSVYTDPGATATDNVDGNITSKIKVNNPVNTKIVGSYNVDYSVKDAAGNAATATRKVIVKEVKGGGSGGGGGGGTGGGGGSQIIPTIIYCTDGTTSGSCSANYQYCDAGKLVDKCSICGCPSGSTCLGTGACSAIFDPSNQTPQPFKATQVLGEKITSYADLYGLSQATVEDVAQKEADSIYGNNSFVNLENMEKEIYGKVLMQTDSQTLDQQSKYRFAYFIHFGTPATKRLGAGERVGVVSSFISVFNRFPSTMADWKDVIKIANGRWPGQRNELAEKQGGQTFKTIYLRPPLSDQDKNAVMILTYGLRPVKRAPQDEKKIAQTTYKNIFNQSPHTSADWNNLRAIVYSGAKRAAQ